MAGNEERWTPWVREQCLALPDAYRDFPFGPDAEVFRIRGKMFGLMTRFERVAPGPILNLKAEVEEVPRLIREHGFIHPGFHMNKRHWVSVSFSPHTDLDLVASLIEDSYDNVVAGLPLRLRPLWARRPAKAPEVEYPQGYALEWRTPRKGESSCVEQSPAEPAARPPGPAAGSTSIR